jgi:NAD(P)-dependent dehydrogenase (short-subunit alcohol dehydrogenase family)
VTGKTALVTGSGIGRACAGMLAEGGAQVMVTGRRAELGETEVSEIVAKGGRAAYHRADLSDKEDARDLVEATVRAYGAIDTVVNNAGLANLSHLGDGSVEVSDPSVWDIAYRVNVRSVMLVTKYAIPHLAASGHGSIINFASILAHRANGWNAYARPRARSFPSRGPWRWLWRPRRSGSTASARVTSSSSATRRCGRRSRIISPTLYARC